MDLLHGVLCVTQDSTAKVLFVHVYRWINSHFMVN